MTEQIELPIPEFTKEQRLSIREDQFRALRFREQSRQLLEHAINVEKQIIEKINKAAIELGADPKIFAVDIDSLNFYRAGQRN